MKYILFTLKNTETECHTHEHNQSIRQVFKYVIGITIDLFGHHLINSILK